MNSKRFKLHAHLQRFKTSKNFMNFRSNELLKYFRSKAEEIENSLTQCRNPDVNIKQVTS